MGRRELSWEENHRKRERERDRDRDRDRETERQRDRDRDRERRRKRKEGGVIIVWQRYLDVMNDEILGSDIRRELITCPSFPISTLHFAGFKWIYHPP